ncbi:helix-turn-helix transcriptional regulator [uncultured Treponema sp.]|uniref:helix-turn-helix domain-containing protein n=2 Tax=uncultured Treponema sp. TaxID=162155 RepID=UPI0025F2B27A|nr:helix-turn-helix transcriptional regulator [uncultured Treponema sp.]
MIHAYDKTYLSKAQVNLGSMLDFAVYDLKEKLRGFYKKFLLSEISARFERGESSVIAGKSGVELALEVSGDFSLAKKYRPAANKSPEYWAGWALAYFQWQTNLTFKKIDSLIPIEEILGMYSPYHEMDISHFCGKMAELYNSRKQSTNLKLQRQTAGFSQKELSEISGVPLRTIQQYEQGQKNINSAKAETVLKLAKVLECSAEDLMEID